MSESVPVIDLSPLLGDDPVGEAAVAAEVAAACRRWGFFQVVNAPLAVRETRRGVREILHLPLADAYARQEEIGGALRKTDDAAEAARAFVEKRRPVWKSR